MARSRFRHSRLRHRRRSSGGLLCHLCLRQPCTASRRAPSPRAFYATYAFANHTVSLRHAGTYELLSFGTILGGKPERQFRDIGLLYGRRLYEGGGVFISAGAGVAAVWEDHAGTPVVFGFPVELQVSLRPTRWLGFGIYAFGNANGTRSLAGAGMGLQVGLVR